MKLKILQWNIGTPFYPFRKEGLQLFPYSVFHKKRIKFINKTINNLDPDVLCIQEYLPKEINLSKYPYTLNIPTEHYPSLRTILFSKIPISSDYLDPKGAFVLGNIANIKIISAHLNTFNSICRIDQINRISDLIRINQKYLVMGDFNMYQIFKIYIQRNDFLSNQKISQNLVYKSKGLIGSSVFPFLELDYFYHSKDINIIKIKTIRNFFKILFAGMDHYPTIVSIEV